MMSLLRPAGPALAFFLTMGCAITSAQDTRKPSQRLTFMDEVFYLAFSNADEKGVINEYVLQGQNLENWTKMIAIRLYYNQSEVEALAKGQEASVKKAFPGTTVGLQVMDGGREARIRFIAGAQKPVPMMEYNVWRYVAMDDPREQVVSYQFAHREYEVDRATYIQKLKPVMNDWTRQFLAKNYSLPSHYVDEAAVRDLEAEGLRLLQEGNYNEGIQRMVRVVGEAPQDPERHLNLGSVLFTYARVLLQQGQDETALNIFNSAEQVLQKAGALYALFDPDDPGTAQSWFLVGEIQFHVKEDPSRAFQSYQRAMAFDPRHQGAKNALALFEEARRD